jgi:hypothetical protein
MSCKSQWIVMCQVISVSHVSIIIAIIEINLVFGSMCKKLREKLAAKAKEKCIC